MHGDNLMYVQYSNDNTTRIGTWNRRLQRSIKDVITCTIDTSWEITEEQATTMFNKLDCQHIVLTGTRYVLYFWIVFICKYFSMTNGLH